MVEKRHRNEGFDAKRLKEIIKVTDPSLRALFDNNLSSPETLASVFRSICLIGLTGHGKSHTCNTLSNSTSFKVSAGMDSETEKVFGVVTKWRNLPKGQPCIIIDTPGIGDSKGRDTANIANMVVDLKTIGYVHTFIIAINSEEPRMSEHLQATIKLFSQMFSKDFFKNVLVCFTKFNNSRRVTKKRDDFNKMSRKTLIKNLKEIFDEKF
jgi:predicted GTPase